MLDAMQCGTPVFAPPGSSNAEAGYGAYGILPMPRASFARS